MAKTIAQIKKENPVYENIPDVELACKIYNKFYKGKLDEESYYKQVFPDIAQKKFEESEEIILTPEDMMIGRTKEDYTSYKPTITDIAEISGVSINDPATTSARLGASFGYNQEQKALAIKNTLSKLYEENIGLLTPLVAESLTEAERRYPHQWIREAFKEATSRNKRSCNGDFRKY